MSDGTQLPINPSTAGRCTDGFCTPLLDKNPQTMLVPSKRVLPIIFIPGIMGSNLRMSASRQKLLDKENNIAWRADSPRETSQFVGMNHADRQRQLDPSETSVDTYDNGQSETGNAKETTRQRNSNVALSSVFQRHEPQNPGVLLVIDPAGSKKRKTHQQKALERGWGEILFDSYGEILQLLERHLNEPFSDNHEPSNWWQENVLNVTPHSWGAISTSLLDPLTPDEFKNALSKTWFPVHAMGYNWLESNAISGAKIATRIQELKANYIANGFTCDKVILITHSMGGLVARAAMHPSIGKIQNIVQGVIHGAMPALGSGTAYKRMRCGFEGKNISIVRNVLGKTGEEVTAVLGNAQGGLELLPTGAYGNGWLQFKNKGQLVLEIPKKGDPFNEIYKIQGRWYQLLNPDWINPAFLSDRDIERSMLLLDGAQLFHQKINNYYHPNSYALYGADSNRATWGSVVWQLNFNVTPKNLPDLAISLDDASGKLEFTQDIALTNLQTNTPPFLADLAPAGDPGDETVPIRSTDNQIGKCKATFRQTGYEHQSSYKNLNVISATLYSIIRIIQ